MTFTAVGAKSEPIMTMPIAIAMIVITTELIERPFPAMYIQLFLSYIKAIEFYSHWHILYVNLREEGGKE